MKEVFLLQLYCVFSMLSLLLFFESLSVLLQLHSLHRIAYISSLFPKISSVSHFVKEFHLLCAIYNSLFCHLLCYPPLSSSFFLSLALKISCPPLRILAFSVSLISCLTVYSSSPSSSLTVLHVSPDSTVSLIFSRNFFPLS